MNQILRLILVLFCLILNLKSEFNHSQFDKIKDKAAKIFSILVSIFAKCLRICKSSHMYLFRSKSQQNWKLKFFFRKSWKVLVNYKKWRRQQVKNHIHHGQEGSRRRLVRILLRLTTPKLLHLFINSQNHFDVRNNSSVAKKVW